MFDRSDCLSHFKESLSQQLCSTIEGIPGRECGCRLCIIQWYVCDLHRGCTDDPKMADRQILVRLLACHTGAENEIRGVECLVLCWLT